MKKHILILASMLSLLCLTAPKQNSTARVLRAETETTHTHDGWTGLDDASDLNSYLTKENNNYYLKEGSYYLTNTLILEKDIYIKGNTEVNFCLNDCLVTSKIKDSTSSYQFIVENGAKFNVYNQEEPQRVWYFYDELDSLGNSNQDGIFENYTYDKNRLTGNLYGKDYLKVEGGVFAGFLTHPILVENFGSFTMNGGSFAGNFTAHDGSCIYVSNNSTITLTDVTFTGNYALQGGAIFASNTSTSNLNNINASYNKGFHGGFLYSSGNVNINGGIYQHNTSDYGSVALVNAGSTLNINGGDFEYNTAGTLTSPSSSGVIYSDSHARYKVNYTFNSCVFKNNITYTDDIYDQEDGGAYGVLSTYNTSSANKISFGGTTVMDENYVVNLSEYSKGTYKATECNIKLYDTGDPIISMSTGDNAPQDSMTIGLTCMETSDEFTFAKDLGKDYSANFISDQEDRYVSATENNGTYSLQCLSATVAPAADGSGIINPVEDKTIVSVEKVSTKDGVDTYQITYSDESTSTFTMAAAKESNTTNNNVLPIIAIVLSAVALLGVGVTVFLQFKKKQ